MRIQFGEFLLDTDAQALHRNGSPIHLRFLAYRLLETLISRRPHAVSKSELLETVWPWHCDTEATLASLVGDLRRRLGDPARQPRWIRTVHGIGYCFAGEAYEEGAPRPKKKAKTTRYRHRLSWGRRELVLGGGQTVIGRDPLSTLWLNDASVAPRHAGVYIAWEDVTLEDLGSHQGTYVNGERLEGPRALVSGDQIQVGRLTLTYHREKVSGAEAEAIKPGMRLHWGGKSRGSSGLR